MDMSELAGKVIRRALDDLISDGEKTDLMRLFERLSREYNSLGKNKEKEKRKLLVRRIVIAQRLAQDRSARKFFESGDYLEWLDPFGVDPGVVYREYLLCVAPGGASVVL